MAVPATRSRLGSLLRYCAKIGLVGGAVYWTATTGVWSRDTAQNAVAIKGFTESVDNSLGGGYLDKVSLPSTDFFASKWNTGVTRTFNAASEIPSVVSRGYEKAKDYVTSTK